MKVRDTLANRALLAALHAELTRPETIDAITDQLTTPVNDIIHRRPAQRVKLLHAREAAAGKLSNLIAAVEAGSRSPSLLSAVGAREAELAQIDWELQTLDEPIHDPTPVIPTWVRQQLENTAAVVADVPERARLEFDRLRTKITLRPIYDEGNHPFLRAEVSCQCGPLAFSHNQVFPTSDRLLRRPGQRTDVACN